MAWRDHIFATQACIGRQSGDVALHHPSAILAGGGPHSQAAEKLKQNSKSKEFLAQRVLVFCFRGLDDAACFVLLEMRLLPCVDFGDRVVDRSERLFPCEWRQSRLRPRSCNRPAARRVRDIRRSCDPPANLSESRLYRVQMNKRRHRGQGDDRLHRAMASVIIAL
jgi:hypothetical protein